MAKRKHIIITRLFEFGGSNTHLKTLVKYLGKENVLLIIDSLNQLSYLDSLGLSDLDTIIKPGIVKYARLNHPSKLSNIKEFVFLWRSVWTVLTIALKHGAADITINSTEPEKYLYLLWLPFLKVNYILHTTPHKADSFFTTYTCNNNLGHGKQIITVSEANKKFISDNWNVLAKKQDCIKVIYNCLDDTPEKSNLPQNTVEQQVLTLGYVIDYKNPYTWLEVAKLVTAQRINVTFTWLGNGPLLADLQQQTNASPQINFAGLVAKPSIYLNNTSIYYQPSLNETHGIAVVEAMSHTLPCVVSAVGGLPESVQDKYNGLLVPAADVQSHVTAIIKLLDDADLRKQYGANSYKKYLASFTYQSFKTAMDTIYAN